MGQDLHKLFKNASIQPESRLSGDILKFIEYKNTKKARLSKLAYWSVSFLSLLGSVFSVRSLVKHLINFGFYDYFSLAFSNTGAIARYWKEYTLSLVDSLPIASLLITFLLLFILFVSLRRVGKFKGKLLIA